MSTERTIVVGDIHGCHDEFMVLLAEVGVKDRDWVVSVGDIVDRGPGSVALYDYFRQRERSIVLMGNHERKHVRRVMSYAQEICKLHFGERYDEFLAWAEALPYYHETEDAIIVHYGFENGVPLAEQREEVLCGSTSGEKYLDEIYHPIRVGSYWTEHYTGDKPIIYGHHVTGDQPMIRDGRIYGIDTGACHGGYLTAVVLPGFRVVQVKAERDHWAEQKRTWQLPVLDARSWETEPFDKVLRTARRFGRSDDPEVAALAGAIESWAIGLQSSITAIRERLAEQARALEAEHGESGFADAVRDLPHRPMLYMARRDALPHDQLQKHLATPARLMELAALVELELPERPRAGESRPTD